MNKSLSRWLFTYGGFLILSGAAGYLSNPEKAKTALMSGGTFGLISIVWGFMNARGIVWSRKAALATLIFLAVIFTWRAAVSWITVLGGVPEKIFAASLISLMLAATAGMLTAMFRKKI